MYLSRRWTHRLVRCVCSGSIGLFQSIKRTSNVLWQRIQVAVTHAVTPTRQEICTDVHQQIDTHVVTPTRQDSICTDVHQQIDTHVVTPTRQDITCTDMHQQIDTHVVTPTRQDSTCTDVHQQTNTPINHFNTRHTSNTCSYNTASTSIRSVSSEFFTASSPITPVKPEKGSSSCVCASVRGSSSHGVEYSCGQYILGGSF